MRLSKGIIIAMVAIISLTGCSKAVNNKGKPSETPSNTMTVGKTANGDTKATGTSADTNIVDEFLYNNSYTQLTKDGNDSWLGKMVDSVKLRDPLTPKRGVIPVTPPDEAFGSKEVPKDTGKVDPTKETTPVVVSIDNNSSTAVLPKPKKFLYDMQNYVGSDLIDNGYLLLYSEQPNKTNDNSSVSISTTLSKTKISNESLETRNSNIRELFKDDKELISAWNNCYVQLVKANETLNKITSSTSLLEHNKEFDINNLYKTYKAFNAKSTKYLIGYNPYVDEAPVKDNTSKVDSATGKTESTVTDTKKQ